MPLFRLILSAIFGVLIAIPAMAQEPAYVGSAACADCHQAEAEAWRPSHHARAWLPATADNILADFDGTELRVSHILLRIEGTQDQGTLAAAVQKAQALREEIVNGRMIFADAATRFSAGPSREHGGDLGFIPRRDRMVEEFSAAAFRLKVGEISPPTVTVFGVHLIKVTEEKPGKIIWQDVREQLVVAAQVPLFRQLAAHLRKMAEVEYTGLIPRLDPSTGKLVPGS